MALNRIPGEDIYIGGLFSLKNKAALSRANITHVVSVLRMRPEESLFESFRHLVIEVDDVEDENLLEHFATTNAFIQSALDAGGSVLVHCAMGKSRSAAVCIAYLLHRQPKALTPQTALDIIRKGRPMCEPNSGFMQQLSLYHQMGCPDDVTAHPMYQRWLSHREIEGSVACGRAPEINVVRFEDELSPTEIGSDEPSTEIRCRKCRRILATTPFIVEHEREDPKALKKKPTTGPECAHIFLHPLTWMRPCLFPGSTPGTSADPTGLSEVSAQEGDAPLSGRLTCPNPKCESNIGKFAWQGMQCSCGKWVVPAMGVARAKVDVVEKTASNAARSVNARLGTMGIRLPPHMRAAALAPEEAPGKGNL
ncbi:hypothetical protein VTN77DRAFT_1179 [Rasamsonia byssochlamydoides]|uniref:uncharacterized protein n=1 Tax=Rasamsonia byssochlamydoides TaxID=89139 RepID=UPI003743B614